MDSATANSRHLTGREQFALGLLVILASLAIFYLSTHYSRAFPEYTIEFKVDRQSALEVAREFILNQNGQTERLRPAVIFEVDERTKTFLERTQVAQDTAPIMRAPIPIWYWSVRYCQPLSPEEYRLKITPQGAIIAYEHMVPESKAASGLNLQQARRRCDRFLRQIADIEPQAWKLVEQRSERLPHRLDHHFGFQRKNYELAGAVERLEVTVRGDQIGAFRHYLKLPEEWLRDYQHLRSLNNSTALVAQASMLPLLIAVLIIFIRQARRREIAWKPTLLWAGITFALSLITQLNSLPLRFFEFDTNQSLSNFYGTYILSALLASLGFGLLVVVIVGAAEGLNARQYPQQLIFTRLFTPAGLRTKHFFLSAVTGLCLVPIFMAFQTFFYLWASRLGAWAPVEVGYSNVLNTALPWLFVLFGGFAPAIMEEGIFRLFAIPYLTKLTRSRVVAVLVPALIWGFAHANYPNQPFWIRGVEVGCFGIIVGLIFLRINVLALLIWHYTVDAAYSAGLMVKMGGAYYVVSALMCAGIVFFPLIYNLIAYCRRKSFEPAEPLTYQNRLSPDSTKKETPAAPLPEKRKNYAGFTRRKRLWLTGLTIVIGLAIALTKTGPQPRPYVIDRTAALALGRQFLQARGVDERSFEWALDLQANYDELTGKYLLENTDYNRFLTLLQRDWQNSVVWQLRFFRPTEQEEWHIGINPGTGEVVAFEHLIPETNAGKELGLSAARMQVEKFLREKHINLAEFEEEKSERQQRPQRTDYVFSYLSRPTSVFSIGEARLRIEVTLKGAEIAGFDTTIKIPEEWRLNQTRQSTMQLIWLVLRIGAVLLICALGISQILKYAPTSPKRFQTFKPVLIGLLLVALLHLLFEYRVQLWAYQTSWELSTYQLVWIILVLLQLTAIGLIGLISYFCFAYGQPGIFDRIDDRSRAAYQRDALLSGVFTLGGLIFISKVIFLGQRRFYPPALADQLTLPTVLASGCPSVAALNAIILATLVALAALSVGSFVWQHTRLDVGWKLAASGLLVAIFILPNDGNWRAFAIDWCAVAILAGWLIACAGLIIRDNYLAYGYTAVSFFTLRQSLLLWQTQLPVGKRTAILLICGLLAGLLWNYLRPKALWKRVPANDG